MDERAALTRNLEERFRKLSLALYDTSLPAGQADREIGPLLAEGVRFTDPWQEAAGRAKYRLGLAGFHALFRFKLEVTQVGVHLAEDGVRGRALVDGVMNLRPLGDWFTYPLRTFLVYDFTLTGGPAAPQVLIHAHEEMWSLGDMIAALPGAGRFYRQVFRPAFSWGFLAASWLGTRAEQPQDGQARS